MTENALVYKTYLLSTEEKLFGGVGVKNSLLEKRGFILFIFFGIFKLVFLLF